MKNLETPGKTGRVGRYVDVINMRKGNVKHARVVDFY